ncbi:MAG: hypothetical protein L7V88_04920 [Alphaproteobacteria bacterium]|nr:hypothetical protein [Alphaproteobacteria bacterium]
MTKNTNFSQEQLEALMKFVTNPNRELDTWADYIGILDQLRKDHKLPTTYVAFEILDSVFGGLERGHSAEKLIEQLPAELSNNVIPIPAAVIGALLNGWVKYKNSEIHDRDMDKSFGLLGKEAQRPPISNMKQLSKELNLVRRVVELTYKAKLDGKAITLFDAFNLVSENEEINVSYETVRKAWYKHRETMNNDLVTKGLPSILV